MNKVELTGRITKDVEVMFSQSGSGYTTFTLAVNRKQKDADGNYLSDFITCKAFGKTAEYMGSYVKKGNMLAVVGEIQTGSYTKNDGSKVYTTDVMVNEVENLSPREQAPVQQAEAPKPKQTTHTPASNKEQVMTELVTDDDLPF